MLNNYRPISILPVISKIFEKVLYEQLYDYFVSILGPLLFLIYINDLPRSFEYSSPRMFADDTTLTVSGKSIQEVEGAINHDLASIKCWLFSNKLSLNLVKTEYLLIGSQYNINNLLTAPNVYVGDTPINRVRVTKALGAHIDEFRLELQRSESSSPA